MAEMLAVLPMKDREEGEDEEEQGEEQQQQVHKLRSRREGQ